MNFNFEKITNYLNNRLFLLILFLLICSIISYIPTYNYIIDIISQFKIQYLYLGTSTLIYYIFAYSKTPRTLFKIFIICSLTIVGLNLYDICKNYSPLEDLLSKNNEQIKIGHFNVLTKNDNYHKILEQVETEKPDIILLEEVNETWLKNIEKIRNQYPYFLEHPREDNFGIALYSKKPLKNIVKEAWTDWEIPVIKADLNDNTRLYYIHTLPPIKSYIQYRNNMLQNISKIINENQQNLIIAGDLNTAKYSYVYKNYIAKTEIKSAQKGFGLKGTWPTSFPPFLRIEIDHILVSEKLFVSSFKTGKSTGSDHLPVFAIIKFAN